VAENSIKKRQLREAVWVRDYGSFPEVPILKRNEWKNACVFWEIFTEEEEKQFLEAHEHCLYLAETIDVCHILGKGVNKKEQFNPDNCFLGNRISHGYFDNSFHPVTGKQCEREVTDSFKKRIMECIDVSK